MSPVIWHASRWALDPVVANEAGRQIEFALLKNFSFVVDWPPHDEIERADVARCCGDVRHAGFDLLCCEVRRASDVRSVSGIHGSSMVTCMAELQLYFNPG